MKLENKDVISGLIKILDLPDPAPLTAETLLALEKEELRDLIVNKAVTELIKILIQKNTIALNDFSVALRAMINRYNQL